jgi:hypothetical protein
MGAGMKTIITVLCVIFIIGCMGDKPRAPQGPLEIIEAGELAAQQLGTSITNLTCTKFAAGRCAEPGKALMPQPALKAFDQVQQARQAFRAAASITGDGVGECLGEARTQAACISAARALLASLERWVIEAQAGGGQ